uniref:Hydroxysteroid dehydrogenase-like protein 2 n=1 Tax=Photinus pyralis TaxID=7054 RepID=A0A1Y1NIX9_PHOPY
MEDLHIEIVDKNVKKLYGKTAFITGGAQGIGREIALRLARDGANVVIAAKTDKPQIHTTVYDVEFAGGRGLAVVMDIRHEDQVIRAVNMAVKKFGGIDILVNNASAISLTDTQDSDMKDYDLINDVNARGTFLVTKTCLPYLKKSASPHVLCIAPPINLKTGWFIGRVGYAIAKYGMSMCVIGMAEEFRGYRISVNALWPRFVIENDQGAANIAKQVCRKATIMGDAAYAIFTREPRPIGEFFLDDQALTQTGVTNLESYCVDPSYVNMLVLNAFVDDSGTIVQKNRSKGNPRRR